MDAAHRGLAAIVESGYTADAVVQRQADRPARRAGDPIPAELRTRLFERLRGSAAIQRVLGQIRRAYGSLNFPIKWSNRGNYQQGEAIYLDLNGNERSWVASLAHELVHLSTFVRGQEADADTSTREEFVRLKMEDEINAQATQYVALLQMGNRRSQPAGYQEFRQYLQREHPRVLERENWARIQRIAREWLEDKYRNEWETSNTGENYYEYWGNEWDRQHGR